MIATLADRKRPLVIMGDFNTDWDDRDGALRMLSDALGLSAYAPSGQTIVTYPRLGRRLDWILISTSLEFIDFRVLQDGVSDHRAVVAEIGLSPIDHAERVVQALPSSSAGG